MLSTTLQYNSKIKKLHPSNNQVNNILVRECGMSIYYDTIIPHDYPLLNLRRFSFQLKLSKFG